MSKIPDAFVVGVRAAAVVERGSVEREAIHEFWRGLNGWRREGADKAYAHKKSRMTQTVHDSLLCVNTTARPAAEEGTGIAPEVYRGVSEV